MISYWWRATATEWRLWPTACAGKLGWGVDIIWADLTDARELAQVEGRLREDTRVGILVNKTGASTPGFLNQSPDDLGKIISLNTTTHEDRAIKTLLSLSGDCGKGHFDRVSAS
jgi:short-subunit dehydrogenase